MEEEEEDLGKWNESPLHCRGAPIQPSTKVVISEARNSPLHYYVAIRIRSAAEYTAQLRSASQSFFGAVEVVLNWR